MKKLFLMTALLVSSLLAMAQQNHVVWREGRVLYAMPVNSMDSITFMDDADQMDTLYMLLPRTMLRVDTVYIYKCPEESVDPDAPLAGVFSVSADKQVKFSKGNLQYTQSTNTWAFAANQYERLPINVENGALADRIDLFGWSGSTGTAKWGISTSTDDNDYSGDFVDWGQNMNTNTTSEGSGQVWRTLTQAEWGYLLGGRANAAELKGIARINLNDTGTEYANGLILLPDSWICPTDITFKSGFASGNSTNAQLYADYQTFTLNQWLQLEASGAVFLPTSGYCNGTSRFAMLNEGNYWSATPYNSASTTSNYMYFYPYTANISGQLRHFRYAVRLVQDL